MFVIDKYSGRSPKWYNPDTREIKCCFCENSHSLESGDSPARHGSYVCSSCEEKMHKKYEYGWWSFRAINNPLNSIYRSGLIERLYRKYGILNERFMHDLNHELSEPCPICHKYHTPRDRVSIFNVCVNCLKDFHGYEEWKESHSRSLIVDVCEKHGFYVSGQPNKNHRQCPECIKESKTVQCEICGKKYISRDPHLERIRGERTHNICDDCCSILPGFDAFQKNRNIRWCNHCKKFIMTSHNFSTCPICGKGLNSYKITCKRCGKETYINNAAKIYCNACEEELSISKPVKEWMKMKKNPMVKITGDGMVTLPIRSFKDQNERINTVKTCQHCGRLYIAHGTTSAYCGDCWHLVTCKNCGKEYLTQPSKWFGNGCKNDESFCSTGCSSSYFGRKRWEEDGVVFAPGGYTPDYDKLNVNFLNVQYKPEKMEITAENVYNYNHLGGVWYREDAFGNLLQVSETMDIFTEWSSVQGIIDSILNGSFEGYCSYVQMQRDGVDLSKTKTFILTLTEDRKRRFDVEAHYAMENRAKYWKPAPGYQIKMIAKIKGG